MTKWAPADLLGLGRPSPLHVDWPAPTDVRIEGDFVTWGSAATRARNGRQHLGPDLVEHFAALGGADDFGSAVAEFVRDFGPLGLDRRGQPLGALDGPGTLRHETDALARLSEPLATWQLWSARIEALLRVVGPLTTGRKVANDDLLSFARVVYAWPADICDREAVGRLRGMNMRSQVAGVVTSWLYAVGVGVGVRWPQGRPFGELSMVGGSGGCLSAILLQLALTMTRTESVLICAGCGLPFTPRRLPREGQRAFCDACRASGVPQKLATRDLRRRRAQKGGT